MPSPIPIGIDLGTTYSAAARISDRGRTELIPNSRGELLTPSVVVFSDTAVEVGRSAWDAAECAPDRLAEFVKRDMGQEFYRHAIHGHRYPPEVIQSCILRELRRDITNRVGENFQAVITVPAYFDELRRKATADAGAMSGLNVLDIVNEPTAAALAFGEKLGYLDADGGAREHQTLVVYDLGGGTFDVTVIQLAPGRVRTLATDGDMELGGYDWDDRLASHIESQFRARWPAAGEFSAADRIRLRRAAERAKIELSSRPLTTIEFAVGDMKLSLPIAIQEFEELTLDLVERSCFTTRQAVQAAGLLWGDIDRLLLVGGSTRMPSIRRALAKLSGMEPDVQVDPDEAVSRGAAIFAHHLLATSGEVDSAVRLEITDVNAHGLGIEGVNTQTLRRENVTLIPRNTPLPCEIHRSFVTKSDGQRNVKIQLLEGESCIPEQCTTLGSAAIRNLPPGLPAGTNIDVCYSFQANGRLAVRAAIPNVGDQAQIELERVRGLADENVVRWKRLLARDGGYSNFEEALVHSVMSLDEDRTRTVSPPSVPLSPAPQSGAPKAADERLQRNAHGVNFNSIPYSPADSATEKDEWGRSRSRTRKVNSGMPIWAKLIGHAVAAIVGMAAGYYLLCWISPESNFLGLELPGLTR